MSYLVHIELPTVAYIYTPVWSLEFTLQVKADWSSGNTPTERYDLLVSQADDN